jgi:hypothetical protein
MSLMSLVFMSLVFMGLLIFMSLSESFYEALWARPDLKTP